MPLHQHLFSVQAASGPSQKQKAGPEEKKCSRVDTPDLTEVYNSSNTISTGDGTISSSNKQLRCFIKPVPRCRGLQLLLATMLNSFSLAAAPSGLTGLISQWQTSNMSSSTGTDMHTELASCMHYSCMAAEPTHTFYTNPSFAYAKQHRAT